MRPDEMRALADDQAAPIEWHTKSSIYGHGRTELVGSLGGIALWTCAWGTGRQPNPYYLECRLPGIKQRVDVESEEAGQARAERQLRAFLTKTGLVFAFGGETSSPGGSGFTQGLRFAGNPNNREAVAAGERSLLLREAADRIDALEGALRRAHEWLERVEDNPGYMGLDHPVGANPDCSMCALLVAAAAVNPTGEDG